VSLRRACLVTFRALVRLCRGMFVQEEKRDRYDAGGSTIFESIQRAIQRVLTSTQ
jgi:hypothetical protein